MSMYLKHILNVFLLYSWLYYNLYNTILERVLENHHDISLHDQSSSPINNNSYAQLKSAKVVDGSDDHNSYWFTFTCILSFLQYLLFLPLPQIICSLLGLTFYNTFPGDVKLIKNIPPEKYSEPKLGSKHCNGEQILQNNSTSALNPDAPLQFQLPHICFRVVTRGSYPELVQDNVNRNYMTCIESGLVNFSIEVVTDHGINLAADPKANRIRELVVPKDYRSSTGALFKARALQYALEPNVSPLGVGDYIVHLDEETIVSENAVRGICNFALEGKYDFGQGLITYSTLGVENILTTLADSYRVADDMGKLRFQLAALHNPIFGWKGSFVVSKYEAEVDVSYDHGPDASVAEDCYFSMVAMTKGYTFDFIHGEMFEKSPFTLMDFIRQRKRWVQGIWLVVHSGKIPFRTKLFLTTSHYACLTLPITTITVTINTIFRLKLPFVVKVMTNYCVAITTYMYIFGLIKSIDLKPKPFPITILYIIIQCITITFNAFIENIAVVWGIFSSKHNFYVVKKDVGEKRLPDS